MSETNPNITHTSTNINDPGQNARELVLNNPNLVYAQTVLEALSTTDFEVLVVSFGEERPMIFTGPNRDEYDESDMVPIHKNMRTVLESIVGLFNDRWAALLKERPQYGCPGLEQIGARRNFLAGTIQRVMESSLGSLAKEIVSQTDSSTGEPLVLSELDDRASAISNATSAVVYAAKEFHKFLTDRGTELLQTQVLATDTKSTYCTYGSSFVTDPVVGMVSFDDMGYCSINP